MIVIGADTHKGSHELAAVDEGTGRVRGSRQIKTDEAGHLDAAVSANRPPTLRAVRFWLGLGTHWFVSRLRRL